MTDLKVMQDLVERALTPTECDHPRVTLERGDVTEPGLVRTALDAEGHPIDGAAYEGAGAVLQVGRQRVFIPYGLVPDSDLRERVSQVIDSQQDVQRALNETSKHAEEMVAAIEDEVGDIRDVASDAAVAAASASGIRVLPLSQPLPTTRANGAPLAAGDLLYRTDGDGNIAEVRIWNGSWIPYAIAAEHVLATGSVVGDLIAAETEIIAPTITGGNINGAAFRTIAPSGEVSTRIVNGYLVFEIDGSSVGHLTSVNWATSGRGVSLAGRGGPLELGGYSFPTPQRTVNTTWMEISALDQIRIRTPKNRGLPGVGRVEINSDPIGSSGDVYGDTYIGQAGGTDKVYIKGKDVSYLGGDTDGWVNLPLGTGLTGSLAYEIKAGRVEVRGEVTRTAGAFPTSYTAIATLPAAARPSSTFRVTFTGDNPTLGVLEANIASTGTISVRAVVAGPGRAWVTIPPFSTT